MSVSQFDVVEASARCEFAGIDDIVNVFQFQKQDIGPTSDQFVIDDIIDILEAFYTILNASVTIWQFYRDIRFTNVTQNKVLGTHSWKTLATGVVGGDALAPGVAALINYGTGIARVTPRKYIGVFTEAANDQMGVWTSAVVGGLTAAAATLMGLIVETNGDYYYGYFSPKTINFEVVNSAVITNIPAYQRRRKQGRGS